MTEQEFIYLKSILDNIRLEMENNISQTEYLIQSTSKLEKQYNLIKEVLDKYSIEPNITINIENYLTPKQYQDYLDSLSEPEMLCDFNIPFKEWINWFYEELPFLTDNKHLVFSNGLTIDTIPSNSIVNVDHLNQEIYLYIGSEKVIINLTGISLYYLLNVKARDSYNEDLVNT